MTSVGSSVQVSEDRSSTEILELLCPSLIHRAFEQQVEQAPARMAVAIGKQSLTYAELNTLSNQLARSLIDAGIGPDRLVALCMERSLQLVVALMAVLKAGGAFVPIDPLHPPERRQHMLQDSGATVLLAQRSTLRDFTPLSACRFVAIDERSWDQMPWAREPKGNIGPATTGVTQDHLAYVIYTSGSTGLPKGVQVAHRNVLNFIRGLEMRIHGVSPDCRRIAWNSSYGFDMAVKAWGQLLMGRTVYLIPDSVRLDGGSLVKYLEDHLIEAIECTPSHLRMMRSAGFMDGRATSLRKVLLGGEPIDEATWRELATFGSVAFFNMYGPTECSVDASCGRVSGDAPNIGAVMPNVRIYLLDEYRRPVPPATPGEIYIAGAGVARGYLNRPDLTRERFVPDPFSTDGHDRMYKTGDLGRLRADGLIEYLGRNDDQVKIRGYRIELGEIEATLRTHAAVADAVVVVRASAAEEPVLVAYVVPRNRERLAVNSMKAHLRVSLPEHMVPKAFVCIDRIPLTTNGKIDRKALPVPDAAAYGRMPYEPPVGEFEETLASMWEELLGVKRIGRTENFFEIGGDSLLATRAISRISQLLNSECELRALFSHPTIQRLTEFIVAELCKNPVMEEGV